MIGVLKDKIVFVTGASSGIGAACAEAFSGQGAKILMAARRIERLETLAKRLPTKCHCVQLDVTNHEQVQEVIRSLPSGWQEIDILLNNAGLSRGLDRLHEGKRQDWEEMIDTNVKGLLYITRVVVPGMLTRGGGHIINIGSTAGHEVYPGGNVYCATKHAVRALTQGLKMDLLGTPLRVSLVDPGLVETEFSVVRFHGDTERARAVYKGIQPLTPRDVAEVVLFCATRPPHVNINDVILMPIAQASATLVSRK
ncbi:MAG: NAD(P)-dependent oxidoreductase [Candidatus Fraserbacteria bacterium RBG_16_55_9]|uniref:NAD(P)-dependent oxidoreductase n=1 Tax=Fraserbacteria sp. (strain RBG_16_55_9) TaxID=1817864 RepID=A0A1F5V1D9_FRAXR|nr:MAG: NAD(P)-dependent oxidoreductase [Candidatus Fraserbacteria bacterium RBG_16_55_9]